MLPSYPVVKDVVLLGGGHSHVEVLRSFGMRPIPGCRLTLITKDVQTPYSGMLPGYVAGFYSYEDTHIDLQLLSSFARCRLIHAEATGLDTKKRQVLLKHRPPMKYDILSIDIGSSPNDAGVPGAKDFTTSVKPISTFIHRLHSLLDTLKHGQSISSPASSQKEGSKEEIGRRSSFQRQLGERGFCVVVVGGGAGGVELAFALKHRLMKEYEETDHNKITEPIIKIVSRQEILNHYPKAVREAVVKLFRQEGIEVFQNNAVVEVTEGAVQLEKGHLIHFDGCLWCTEASAAPWIKETGLLTDDRGFIRINDHLQAFDGPAEVFAAGDIATSVSNPRPKAGVFAVRQGPPLAANIRRFLQGENLQPFTPQSTYLSLISTGNKSAVGCKGWLFWQGSSMWKLKDSIDRSFMYKYGRDLPKMENMTSGTTPLNEQTAANLLEKQTAILSRHSKQRCAGCGGKVGMRTLENVLKAIRSAPESIYDDAAIIQPPPPGHVMLQTTDFLRSFVSDPYLFGQITALHCLSDIYAMGGRPTSVVSTAIVPFAAQDKMEADLIQAMMGAKKVFDDVDCSIIGGHTAEGSELSLGFTVTGSVLDGNILKKSGIGADQSIILTKPLGTGMILAAEMIGKAKASWMKAACESMLLSNGPASSILKEFGVEACTDVTGFGLMGHLTEMMYEAKVSVSLDLMSIPILDGSETCSKNGWLSSLYPQNKRSASVIENYEDLEHSWEIRILMDPQTNGGLLAFVPEDKADRCVEALQSVGYQAAVVVGRTVQMKETASGRHFSSPMPPTGRPSVYIHHL